jgi:hypothetical protein
MSSRRAAAALSAMLLATTAMNVLTPSPAAAAVYAPGLCSAGDDRETIGVPRTWEIARVHATSDFVNDSNGYSFRTCSWRGTRHTYTYSCTNENSDGWTLQLVARENGSGEATRVVHPVVCDGLIRTAPWNRAHRNNDRVHFHLWSSGDNPTSCGSSCNRYLNGWMARISD